MFSLKAAKHPEVFKITLRFAFKLYRYLLFPFLNVLCGPNFGCRFVPHCSAYAEEAFHIHGIGYGTWLTLKRIFRCHPFTEAGYDPVPRAIANTINQFKLRKAIQWIARLF